jgi:hypothetical protein
VNSLLDDFYFVSAPPSPGGGDLGLRAEIEYWASIRDSSRVEMYQEFLSRFPNSQYASVARAKIQDMQRRQHDTPSTRAPSPVPQPGGAQPAAALSARRFQNGFLTATVDSVGSSRDTTGSYISLSVTFESRSKQEELLMCVKTTVVDDQAREWDQSQGSGLATIRVGYNYTYGPNGVAYSLGYHTKFSPNVQETALMRFTRSGTSTSPSTVTLTMDCYRRRGDIDEPFSIGITRIPIGGGQAQ